MTNVRIAKGPFLWVALDGLSENESLTLDIADELVKVEGDFGFKVNHDLILKHGAKDARAILPDCQAFADVKMWNGAKTMSRTFDVLYKAGFDATNVYALAGVVEM